MDGDDRFVLGLELGESWATAVAWLAAVNHDEQLAERLTAQSLWDLAGGDIASLRAVLPPPEMLDEIPAPVLVEPMSLDREVVYLGVGDYVVSVFLRWRDERRDWRVEAVVTEHEGGE
jgi:hypothetical protein